MVDKFVDVLEDGVTCREKLNHLANSFPDAECHEPKENDRDQKAGRSRDLEGLSIAGKDARSDDQAENDELLTCEMCC